MKPKEHKKEHRARKANKHDNTGHGKATKSATHRSAREGHAVGRGNGKTDVNIHNIRFFITTTGNSTTTQARQGASQNQHGEKISAGHASRCTEEASGGEDGENRGVGTLRQGKEGGCDESRSGKSGGKESGGGKVAEAAG